MRHIIVVTTSFCGAMMIYHHEIPAPVVLFDQHPSTRDESPVPFEELLGSFELMNFTPLAEIPQLAPCHYKKVLRRNCSTALSVPCWSPASGWLPLLERHPHPKWLHPT